MAWLLAGDRLPYSVVAMGHGEHAAASTATRMSHASGHFMAMWLAMILAMAPPLLLREIGRLWRTSLHRLRHVTLAWFVCGYVGHLAGGRRRPGDALRMGDRQLRAHCHGSCAGRALALLAGASALSQCLPPRADVARVRNAQPSGIRCDMESQPAGIAPGPAVSLCSWSCSQRTITSSAWPSSRSWLQSSGICPRGARLAASHLARPITGVAPDACRDPKCRCRFGASSVIQRRSSARRRSAFEYGQYDARVR